MEKEKNKNCIHTAANQYTTFHMLPNSFIAISLVCINNGILVTSSHPDYSFIHYSLQMAPFCSPLSQYQHSAAILD